MQKIKYRVLLVDNHLITETLCKPIELAFQKLSDYPVSIDFAGDIRTAQSMIENNERYHLVLSDIHVDNEDPDEYSGMTWLLKIGDASESRPRYLGVLSSKDSIEAIEETYGLGLSSYLSKEMSVAELAVAIHRVVIKGGWKCDRLIRAVIDSKKDSVVLDDDEKRLVFELLQNKTNVEIAQSMGYKKLDKLSRAQKRLGAKTNNVTKIGVLMDLLSNPNSTENGGLKFS